MRNTFIRRVAIVGLLLGLSACGDLGTGSKYEPGPVGPGSSVKELKQTPCACVEIPMQFPDNFGYTQYSASAADFLNLSEDAQLAVVV